MEQAQNIVYLTGDTHGRFDRVIDFCLSKGVTQENTFIILGDAGLNYFGDGRDALNKEALSKLPITFFCIHGNHEMPRPRARLRTAALLWWAGLGPARVSQYHVRH